MIHHLCFLSSQNVSNPEQIDNLMIETRVRLLKIPEIMNLRVGKNISPNGSYFFFFSFDVDSIEKLELVKQSPYYYQFEKQILAPLSAIRTEYDFEMEPRSK
ncbi:hypothetical protein A7K93_11210 [Candidatus Methylacidiphilum fumarolicum]|uniref:Stress-response A/B barrel domain-containing protein n=2 Tax=Candidatus Methylacidiphilum fumarolicum TaxID=591154 RepID=I0JWM3_METFB|nr:Dabb family protein [Candidatus Methylacidiphilum fumarolicum]MBW6414335.1 Dabb family protein [Candidatus Methylacidiphilum fumarolicum]TFE65831.1 hypothetical protein A7K73_11040 [Candidatus Methylacidiphilum fumarolicum]TFE71196.1 hypothetical protein A7K93_11210 [Candidatus Methylacidiphilum fumarolicum]TFE71647.1 hypothetical protein A7K72_10445 [Candidatus Methylacidiphilum fumarolicum]TFE76881.1 hypothetical protein A7D33_07730 [Candidatus Methylacidiphilum fumarolicum]